MNILRGLFMYDYFIKASIKTEEEGFHWHDLVEIISVLSGKMTLTLNNQNYALAEGDIVVLNCDDVHRIESKSFNLIYACCHINIYAFDDLLPNISNVKFKCGTEEMPGKEKEAAAQIREKINRIVLEFTKLEKGYENRAVYYAADLLTLLKSKFSTSVKCLEKFGAAALKAGNSEKVEDTSKIYQYLYDHYKKKLTLKEVAHFANLSETVLSQTIKADTGMTFEDLVNQIRIEYAINLLLSTDKSQSDISELCGFSSTQNFYTTFRKLYGCTPSEYRKRNKICFESQVQKAAYLHKMGVLKMK